MRLNICIYRHNTYIRRVHDARNAIYHLSRARTECSSRPEPKHPKLARSVRDKCSWARRAPCISAYHGPQMSVCALCVCMCVFACACVRIRKCASAGREIYFSTSSTCFQSFPVPTIVYGSHTRRSVTTPNGRGFFFPPALVPLSGPSTDRGCKQ